MELNGRVAPAAATLRAALGRAEDAAAAAGVVVEHLVALGFPMPSVYLERGGRLRCAAQQGYWQVYNGVPPGQGVLGRVYASGEPLVLRDVEDSDDYLGAVGAVVAEVCVPVRASGEVVGVLNVETEQPLSEDDPELTLAAADCLGHRLEELGGAPTESAAERLARYGAQLAGLSTRDEVSALVLAAACDLSGMASAALVLPDATGFQLAVTGPLAETLQAMPAEVWQAATGWVQRATSVHSQQAVGAADFAGTQQLRDAGVVTHIVAALVARDARLGVLLVADSVPAPVRGEQIALIELLATQAAACLRTSAAVESLRQSERRFRALAEHASDLVCLHEWDGRFSYVSPSVSDLLGYRPEQLHGTAPRDLMHAEDLEVARQLWTAHGIPGRDTVEVRLRRADGSYGWFEVSLTPVFDGSGAAQMFQTCARDVTQRKYAEQMLTRQAERDALTDLANRVVLENRLEDLSRPCDDHVDVSVLFIDLDDFKNVNDRYDHGVGDEALVEVARRLADLRRRQDTLVRYGGDEFVLLATDLDQDGAAGVARRVLDSLAEPVELSAGTVKLAASVGIAFGVRGSDDLHRLIRAADWAMYRAKSLGGNQWAVAESAHADPVGVASLSR